MHRESADLTPKAQRTRSKLLAAAKAEIGTHGIAGVTVLAVCDRAGVGRTSFYKYFEDADALIQTVAREASTDIKERFNQLHQNVPRGQNRLEACFRMILTTAVEAPDTVMLIVSLSDSLPEIYEILETEIAEELAAVSTIRQDDTGALVQHLAVTILALARQFSLSRFPRKDVDRHVNFMMSACLQ